MKDLWERGWCRAWFVEEPQGKSGDDTREKESEMGYCGLAQTDGMPLISFSSRSPAMSPCQSANISLASSKSPWLSPPSTDELRRTCILYDGSDFDGRSSVESIMHFYVVRDDH